MFGRQGAGNSRHDVLVGKTRQLVNQYYDYSFGEGTRIVVGNRAFWHVTAFVQAHGRDETVTRSAQPQLVTIQDGLKIGLGGVLKIGNSVRTEPFGAELKIRVSRKVGYAADGTQSVHLSTATMLVSVVPTPLNPGRTMSPKPKPVRLFRWKWNPTLSETAAAPIPSFLKSAVSKPR